MMRRSLPTLAKRISSRAAGNQRGEVSQHHELRLFPRWSKNGEVVVMVVAIWKTHRQRPELEGSIPFDYENNRLTMKEFYSEFFHC